MLNKLSVYFEYGDCMNKEREKIILEMLLKKKRVTVKELSHTLYISEPSVRRDLADLEKQNLIKRIHGGAVLEETLISKNKIPFIIREYEQSSAKTIIAQKAADYVKDNDIVFLDASTSAFRVIPFLLSKANITVVTNGVRALTSLAEFNINTISTGGRLVNSCLALVGDEAYKTIDSINANIAFFSCRGLSEDGYLTDISPEEDYVRQRMIKNAEHAYLLCATDKFGKKYYHNLCHKDDIDGIISEMYT